MKRWRERNGGGLLNAWMPLLLFGIGSDVITLKFHDLNCFTTRILKFVEHHDIALCFRTGSDFSDVSAPPPPTHTNVPLVCPEHKLHPQCKDSAFCLPPGLCSEWPHTRILFSRNWQPYLGLRLLAYILSTTSFCAISHKAFFFKEKKRKKKLLCFKRGLPCGMVSWCLKTAVSKIL